MIPTIEPLSDAVGAEVSGVDLDQALAGDTLDADIFALIRAAFHDYGALVFRDQRLSEDQHIAFSARFGELEIHVATEFLLPDHPEIVVLSNKATNGKSAGIVYAGRFWHSDLSYMARPSLGSLLYAREVPPPAAGGDTLFAGMYAAYAGLDEALKHDLAGLNAVHSYEQRWRKDAARGMDRAELATEDRAKVPAVTHPVVRSHPITGRRALYVNAGFTIAIDGWPEDESNDLLERLFAHSTKDRFVHTHQWRAHDLVMWDNACVIHAATPYDPTHVRHMHRTTVAGPELD